jgi:hypothetical protein
MQPQLGMKMKKNQNSSGRAAKKNKMAFGAQSMNAKKRRARDEQHQKQETTASKTPEGRVRLPKNVGNEIVQSEHSLHPLSHASVEIPCLRKFWEKIA